MSDKSSFIDRVNQALLTTNVDAIRESCIFATITHGTMGFVFGGFLGLFLSSFSASSPEMSLMMRGGAVDAAAELSTRAQIRMALSDMGRRTWSSAKGFGKIAAIYSASECVIEGYRAKHDIWNTLGAGCFTGGALQVKSGPKSALIGCAGFAAFSAAIEHFFQDRT